MAYCPKTDDITAENINQLKSFDIGLNQDEIIHRFCKRKYEYYCNYQLT